MLHDITLNRGARFREQNPDAHQPVAEWHCVDILAIAGR
jgi:hypothetical protein